MFKKISACIKIWLKKIRTEDWRKHCREDKIKKSINNLLFKYYFTNYQNPSDMYKKLRETKGKSNEDQVYSIREVLNKI